MEDDDFFITVDDDHELNSFAQVNPKSCGCPSAVEIDLKLLDLFAQVKATLDDPSTSLASAMVSRVIRSAVAATTRIHIGQSTPTPANIALNAEHDVTPFSVAPMMDWTDRHYRYMARMLTKKTHLYTEMISDAAVVYGKPDIIEFSPQTENPVVLQLGGSTPHLLGQAANKSLEHGYVEFNLNVGCPSDRGQKKCNYGAVLMKEPQLVAQCMTEIRDAVPSDFPCTVKCRIGVGPTDDYDEVKHFVYTVHSLDRRISHFIVHARRAILGKKLTPAQNRSVPPLHYDFVYRLVEDFPMLKFTLNGGVHTLDDVSTHLSNGVHGVMVGRAAIHTPWSVLRHADSRVFGVPDPQRSRRDILEQYLDYAEEEVAKDPRSLSRLLKPTMNLFADTRQCTQFRRTLEAERRKGSSVREIVTSAMQLIDDEDLDAV